MLDDVQRRTVRLPDSGLEIALLDWGGEGPAALLHHANGFCAGLWAPVAERLRPHFRVVAVDARGHGDSSKPEGFEAYHWSNFPRDVLALADALADEIPGFALGLGHSFGGTTLALAAGERPGLFERIVLLEPVIPPAAFFETEEVRQAHTRRLVNGALQRRHVWESREEAREKWSGKESFASWTPRALELYVTEGMRDLPDGRVGLKCPGEVEAAIFGNNNSVDVMAEASRVETPALVVWAVRGNWPRAHFEEFAGRMRDARVHTLDTGHFVPMEDPDAVVEEVLAFSAPSDGRAPSSPSSPPPSRRPS